MRQKDLFEPVVRGADSDAADNKRKRDADIEGDLLREALDTFSGQYDFKPGMIIAGCSLLRKSGNRFFLILELRDDQPLFDIEARHGTSGYEMLLDMLVGKADEDGDLISLWVDRRRFELMPEELLPRR
jgi:hypothetical protein